MLDRGQFQQMAFGACTISPEIPEWLPFHRRFIRDEHYVVCNTDFSDLLEKIEWCRENRSRCKAIGYNAARLFSETSTPRILIKWIKECLV